MPQEYIYFIKEEETNNIKIGFSENPVQRLKDFQTGNSNKPTLIGHIEGGADEENKLKYHIQKLQNNSNVLE